MAASPPVQKHYPFSTRTLIDLYSAGELPSIAALTVEPVYGYVGRITYHDGRVRFFRSTNMGVNNHGAVEISKDKGYTRYFLDQLGYITPEGRTFLLPDYVTLIDTNLRRYGFSGYPQAEIDAIDAYIRETVEYPCFVKANEGSQGRGVHKCFTVADVHAALEDFAREKVRVCLVERDVRMPDYRVVVWDGSVRAAYGRQPFTVTGDGVSTVAVLLASAQATFDAQGRSALFDPADRRLSAMLARQGYHAGSVPENGVSVQIHAFSNLSTGGAVDDVTDRIHPHWRDLCSRITTEMGLRLCGVDLACADITDPASAYAIIEINASPGLDNYASSGAVALARVRDLYRDMLA